MSAIDRAENERDSAAAELEILRDHVEEARGAMEAHLHWLSYRIKASNKDLSQAATSLGELLSELAFDTKTEIEGRLSEAQDALSHAESLDERRSAPVVI